MLAPRQLPVTRNIPSVVHTGLAGGGLWGGGGKGAGGGGEVGGGGEGGRKPLGVQGGGGGGGAEGEGRGCGIGNRRNLPVTGTRSQQRSTHDLSTRVCPIVCN